MTRGRRWGLGIAGTAVAVAVVAGAVTMIATGMGAAEQQAAPLAYVALGDSFAAGSGAGTASGPCDSTAGYPAILDEEARVDLVRNASCGGATTLDVRDGQVGVLSATTDLVTLTVGGNDLNALSTALTCSAGPGSDECRSALAGSLKLLSSGELTERLGDTVANIADAAPEARILVTGYPHLYDPGTPGAGAASALLSATTALNQVIEETVREARAAGAVVEYVDVSETFAGHGIGSPDPWLVGAEGPGAFHPTAAGYDAYAEAIAGTIDGRPEDS